MLSKLAIILLCTGAVFAKDGDDSGHSKCDRSGHGKGGGDRDDSCTSTTTLSIPAAVSTTYEDKPIPSSINSSDDDSSTITVTIPYGATVTSSPEDNHHHKTDDDDDEDHHSKTSTYVSGTVTITRTYEDNSHKTDDDRPTSYLALNCTGTLTQSFEDNTSRTSDDGPKTISTSNGTVILSRTCGYNVTKTSDDDDHRTTVTVTSLPTSFEDKPKTSTKVEDHTLKTSVKPSSRFGIAIPVETSAPSTSSPNLVARSAGSTQRGSGVVGALVVFLGTMLWIA